MISIIIVTYNCVETIEETIQSLIKQTSSQYEVCFIDGSSTDGTIKLIEKYKLIFEKKGINVTFITEKDRGIYDAMNKGVILAKGEYIYFLNAKDKLYSEDTILKISKFAKENNADIIYGNVDTGIIKKQNLNVKEQLLFKGICHQAVFIKRSLFDEIGMHKLEYKISADFEFFVRALCKEKTFSYIDLVIAYYDMGGFSTQKENINKGHKEYIRIIRLYFSKDYLTLFRCSLRYVLMSLKFNIKNLIKK